MTETFTTASVDAFPIGKAMRTVRAKIKDCVCILGIILHIQTSYLRWPKTVVKICGIFAICVCPIVLIQLLNFGSIHDEECETPLDVGRVVTLLDEGPMLPRERGRCVFCVLVYTVYGSAGDKTGVTTLSECPITISVTWNTKLPTETFTSSRYPVQYSTQIAYCHDPEFRSCITRLHSARSRAVAPTSSRGVRFLA